MMIDRFGSGALRSAVLAACVASSGCVTMEETAQAPPPRDDGYYRTGSRLPSANTTSGAPVGTLSKDEWIHSNIRREGASPPQGTAGN